MNSNDQKWSILICEYDGVLINTAQKSLKRVLLSFIFFICNNFIESDNEKGQDDVLKLLSFERKLKLFVKNTEFISKKSISKTYAL